jgi:hypothetical protein
MGKAYAQTTPTLPINTIVERVQKYFQVYPVEKVHLHFDKPYYAVGDTLWFSTYLSRNLAEYEPSKIAYVEVLNSRDSLIQTLKIPLDKGVGNGQIVLDPQLCLRTIIDLEVTQNGWPTLITPTSLIKWCQSVMLSIRN